MGNTRSFPCSCWILITTASLFISLYLLNNPSEMREKTPLRLEADWSLMGKDAWVPSIGGDVFFFFKGRPTACGLLIFLG